MDLIYGKSINLKLECSKKDIRRNKKGACELGSIGNQSIIYLIRKNFTEIKKKQKRARMQIE